MPADLGMSFVVVQHLPAESRSALAGLLQRQTPMPVTDATDGLRLESGRIYLIPPGGCMTIDGGRLVQARPARGNQPINELFTSLALEAGERAIAVILSGTGSDGAMGALRVADQGGLVIVESEDSAEFSQMPQAVLKSGAVDRVLPASEIGLALQHYVELPRFAATLSENGYGPADDLEAVLELLRVHGGLDFGHYRPSTVVRRLNRRIALRNTSLADYLEVLTDDPTELDALYRDLQIGVTHFFRDEAAFRRIADLLELRIRELEPGQELRIWSAGCATGEEAYSLTAVANDAFRRAGREPLIRVIGTDVVPGALEAARKGCYTLQAVDNVPEEVLRRYFVPVGDGVAIRPELRSQIEFIGHDILGDEPFEGVDLISCRNLLIYFTRLAQQKALSLLETALNQDGLLWLGPSETAAGWGYGFEAIDSRWKIFRRSGPR